MNENIIQYQEYLLKQVEKKEIKKINRLEYLKILAKTCPEYIKMIPADKQDMKDEVQQYVREYMLDFQKDESKTPQQEYEILKENIDSFRHTNKRTSKIAKSISSLTPTSLGDPFPDEDKIEFGKHSNFTALETYIQDILNTPNNHKEVESIAKLVSYDNHKTSIGLLFPKIRKLTRHIDELRSAFYTVLRHGIEYPEYYLIIVDNNCSGFSNGLINCVYKNDTETFTELLKRGANTFYYNEALWGLCCAENKKDFLNLMVDYASDDVNYSMTHHFKTPQYFDRDELGLYALKNIFYSYVDKTVFDSAIQYNHTDIAERLIQKGYKVNRYNNCHDSMVYACYKCYPNMIQSLADFGYNMSDRYFKGDTQHHILTLCHLNEEDFNKKGEFFDCVQALVNNGVDINAKNENGDTPLHIITKERHYVFDWGNVTHMLCHNAEFMTNCYLENGANPNIKDKDGNTPLHLVLSNCIDAQTLPIVENLLKHGAKPDIYNHKLVTPYALAFKMLKNAPDTYKRDARQILKLCQDAKPSLLAKITRYFSGVQR